MKNHFTFFFFLSYTFYLHAQDLAFFYTVENPTSSTAAVKVFVQKQTSGTENMAGFTVDFYYDDTESTLTSFDDAPAAALGWDTNTNDDAFTADNNPTVTITHTGFGTINVIDNNFVGSSIGTSAVHILTINFDHTVGTDAASEGYMAATVPNNRLALSYINNNGDEYPVSVIGQQSQPLPIELSSFIAIALNATDAQLDWTTASEQNASHFEVERRTSVGEWMHVGTVEAFGNSQALQQYRYIDQHVFDPSELSSAVFYYRLKMVDADRGYEYSQVKSVEFKGEVFSINVFPNPAHQFTNIQLHSANESALVKIWDMAGRTVHFQEYIGGEDTMLRVETGDWRAGQYVVQVTVGGRSLVKQLVVN